MPKKVTDTNDPPKPITRPTRNKADAPAPTPEPEAQAPEPQVETQPKVNKKALANKTDGQRHPITATVPVFKRAALVMWGASITKDKALNPKAVSVKLGSLASMLTELMADLYLGDATALQKLQAIANAEDPIKVASELALAYKLAQSRSETVEDIDTDDVADAA